LLPLSSLTLLSCQCSWFISTSSAGSVPQERRQEPEEPADPISASRPRARSYASLQQEHPDSKHPESQHMCTTHSRFQRPNTYPMSSLASVYIAARLVLSDLWISTPRVSVMLATHPCFVSHTSYARPIVFDGARACWNWWFTALQNSIALFQPYVRSQCKNACHAVRSLASYK
jgi:hypothetical protein